MSNTVIQLKYSTVTAMPTALNIAEPAYSYVSNTLFIGSPDSAGAIAIGGQFYIDKYQRAYDTANAAYASANNSTKANAAFDQANAAFITANSAGVYANGAFSAANIAQAYALSAGSYANSAFAKANNEGGVNLTQNNSITAAFIQANSAAVYANGAFVRANNSLNANTGGTVTGAVTITGDFSVTGNLVISGNTVTQNVTSLNISDPLIYLASNNYSSDIVDIGFAANYFDGANERHTGFFRDATTKRYYLFDNYTPELSGNNEINVSDSSFRIASLNANLISTSITLNAQDLQTYVDGAYNKANASFNSANLINGVDTTQNNSITAAFIQANSAAIYANGAFAAANAATATDTTQNNSITAAFNTANSAFIQANAVFSLANGTAGVANTDYTTLTAPSGNYGNGATIAAITLAANGRVTQANSTLISIGASQITSGTLGVARGGTGLATITANGVLLGNGTSAITTASSSTEGHVLTINSSGVPTFMHLQGGTF